MSTHVCIYIYIYICTPEDRSEYMSDFLSKMMPNNCLPTYINFRLHVWVHMPEEIDVATYATKNVRIYFRMRAQVDVRRCMCQNLFQKVGQTSENTCQNICQTACHSQKPCQNFQYEYLCADIWTWACFFYKRTRAPINLRIMWAT